MAELFGYVAPRCAVTRPSLPRKRIRSAVLSLLLNRGPAAIFGGVVTIIVDPLNRMPWRRFRPHVGQEVLKGVQPTRADGDSPAAVSSEPDMSWIQASRFHVLPRTIFRRRLFTAGGRPMLLYGATSALSTFPSSQVRSLSVGESPTFAFANPKALSPSVPSVANYYKFPEGQSQQITALHISHSIPEDGG